ncbi:alpha/beta hydrolase [Streptomyces sp. NPDC001851]|uniref:alpha/beta fold hydrolase n=1 Tax=Streptomyces sp. NPDC001851 TaxID=3154529 RepID=UPI003330920B
MPSCAGLCRNRHCRATGGRALDRQPRLQWCREAPGMVRWLVRAVSDLPDRNGWIEVLDALQSSDLSRVLPQITAPTLVLCGERDRAGLPDARRTAAAVPRAHLSVVPHTGHLLPVTAPHAFNAIARGFLTPECRQTR